MAHNKQLSELLAPVVESMDYEFVGLEYLSGSKPALLRIYIDHSDGISVDDCADVSRQISAILDVEDPITTEYNLEVSSPGLDRPLFNSAHYQQVVGERVKVQTRFPVEGRRKYTGILVSADDNQLELEFDNTRVTLSMRDIEKGRLIYDHSR